MKNEKTHAMLLGLVGGYILYLAYQLFEKYRSGAEEMPPALNILAIIVLGAGGIGTVVYAVLIYRKAREESRKKEENEPGGE